MADSAPRWPPRLPLIHARTPLVTPLRTADELGIDLRIKRDDLTGVAASGNKIRKLEYIAADAVAEGADTLITCGGVNSNHARSTAVVAARLGMRSHLVLRGEDRRPPTGNLLLDKLLGAGLTFIGAREWPERNTLMHHLAEDLRAEGRRPYVIPEGGTNALGSLAYAVAIPEILEQLADDAPRWRRIVHATGSGGTTAGLAIGLALLGRTDVDVIGVAVCNDRTYFDERIAALVEDTEARGWISSEVRAQTRWTILEGYKGRGYARTTAREMAEHAALARAEGLLVDPVYTGKAFRALRHEALKGRWRDGVTVFLHTGGIFELFAYGHEIQALPPCPSE